MDNISIISDIEDQINDIDNNCFYHAFYYDNKEFVSMLNEGIKSPLLLSKKAAGYNGYFYVSLTKREKCEMSIYKKLYDLPKFIINPKIRTIKTKNYIRYGSHLINITNTFLPFRESEYDDEYQKFIIVHSKDIIGIEYNLYSNYLKYGDIRKDLVILESIINNLIVQKRNIPIIDNSSKSIISKDKVLSIKQRII